MIYVLIRTMFEGSPPGFPFLASIVTIFGGAQLFSLGVIGEYLGRMFERTMNRPTYVIRTATGDTTSASGDADE
jgi:undecaprenyl-phosphate 4-deoxy-4-formamido-L-arabinose transferase